MFKKKRKYIAVFLQKEHNSYTIHSTRKFKPNTVKKKTIKHKGKLIPFDTVNYSFSDGLKLFYYISITEKKQLFFENTKDLQIGSKVIDMILNDDIIAQITSNLNKSNFKANLVNMIFSALFGGLIGYIIGGLI